MGKLKLSQISYPVATLEGQGNISCGQNLDRTLGKFPPLYGPHLCNSISTVRTIDIFLSEMLIFANHCRKMLKSVIVHFSGYEYIGSLMDIDLNLMWKIIYFYLCINPHTHLEGPCGFHRTFVQILTLLTTAITPEVRGKGPGNFLCGFSLIPCL